MTTTTSKKDDAFRAFDLGTDDPKAEDAALNSVRRFLFSYDFDHPEQKKEEVGYNFDDMVEDTDKEPAPPPPMFTEEDLEQTREEARVLGHAQGLKDAEESALHFLVLAIEAVADQMDGLYKAQEEANKETHRMAAALAVAIVQKLLPTYVRDHGVTEVETLVTSCLPHILNEPRLILRVSPGNEEAMRERIEPMARDRGFDGSVVIMGDPSLEMADCRLEWDNGGAERSVSGLFKDIQAIVNRNAETLSMFDAEVPQEETSVDIPDTGEGEENGR